MRIAPIVLAATAFLALAASSPARAPAFSASLAVSARADQTFAPDRVTLQVGRLQTITFTSAGGVHGIASPALGIAPTTIAPGTATDVEVTPKRTGTFVLPCTIVCGTKHASMRLTITVVR